jgi:hypothetical protein
MIAVRAYVTCDRCGVQIAVAAGNASRYYIGIAGIRHGAKRLGWTYRKVVRRDGAEYQDLCRRCAGTTGSGSEG